MTYSQQDIKQSQVHLDQRLFHALRYLKVVGSQYEFSRMMGRNPSYFSCVQCKHTPVSAAALASLYRRISTLTAQEVDPCRKSQLTKLKSDLEDEINQRLH